MGALQQFTNSQLKKKNMSCSPWLLVFVCFFFRAVVNPSPQPSPSHCSEYTRSLSARNRFTSLPSLKLKHQSLSRNIHTPIVPKHEVEKQHVIPAKAKGLDGDFSWLHWQQCALSTSPTKVFSYSFAVSRGCWCFVPAPKKSQLFTSWSNLCACGFSHFGSVWHGNLVERYLNCPFRFLQLRQWSAFEGSTHPLSVNLSILHGLLCIGDSTRFLEALFAGCSNHRPQCFVPSGLFTWMQPCDKGFEVGRRDDNLFTKNKQKKSHWNVARQKDWSVTISLCSLLGPYLFTPNPRPFSSCLCTSKVPVTSRDRAFHAVTWRSGNLSPPSSDWFNWGMIHDFLHHEKHTVLIWKILWILWFLYKSLVVQTKFAIIFVQTTTRIDDLHSWPQGTSHGRKIHEAKLWVVCSLDLQFLPGLLSLFFTLSTQRIYGKHLRNGKGFISTYLYIVYVSFL